MSVGHESQTLLSLAFDAEVIHWRGPAPFLFARVPAEHAEDIRRAARLASYGWGVVPVEAEIASFAFRTSLFPRDGSYLLPLKLAVQRATGIGQGDSVHADVRVIAHFT